jgi:hypothetical protein
MNGPNRGSESGSSQDVRPQLHGWKDIASYFGRSVRTVQRWERDFGLPVRRYGMGRAELVHAYLEDLERWKASAEAQAARRVAEAVETAEAVEAPEAADEDGPARAPAPAPPPAPPARSRIPAAITLITALLAIGAIAVWMAIGGRGTSSGATGGPGSGPTGATTGRPTGSARADSTTGITNGGSASGSPPQPGAIDMEPGGWEFQGNVLVVENARGRLLWTHEFPFRLMDMVKPLARSDPDFPVRIEDVDGDGHQEVLAISSPVDGRGEKYRFHAFSHTGRLLWDHARGGDVVFGDATYTSPFLAQHFYLTPREPRGSNLWLVSNHRPWFPSVMENVDLDGTLTSEYWSAGYVTRVWEGVVAGRRVLLVGARNNESEGASLAMLDAARPAGSAPAEEARYRCRTCPPVGPLRFVKFPKPKRLQPLGGTGPVKRINVDSGSRILVWVAPAHDTGVLPGPEVIYTLDADLRPLSVSLNDAFDASVRVLAGRKLIPEPPATPAIDEAQTVRWWDGTRFVSLTAPPRRP